MKHVIETGTDAAGVCAFDPAALPDDFDERARKEAVEQLEQLAAQGRLWWNSTDGDGGYLIHVYVDEDVPAAMHPHLHDPMRCERFQIPSGVLCACGVEYVARDPFRGAGNTPKGGLGKYSHMGGRCDVPPGTYELTTWRTEWPEGMLEGELEKELGPSRVKAGNRLGVLTGVFVFATLLLSIVTLGLTIGALRDFRARLGELAMWWSGVVGLGVIAIGLMKRLTRQERNPKRRDVEHRFPGIVLHLRKKQEIQATSTVGEQRAGFHPSGSGVVSRPHSNRSKAGYRPPRD